MALVLRLLWRDWRGGELSILLLSLVLATATITSISLFVSRIQNSIIDEASHFLAADAQVRGSIPIHQEWKNEAQNQELKTAHSINFRGMVFSETGMQLGQVKAVSNSYPLKGELQLSSSPFGAFEFTGNSPKRGEVWLASRIFGLLDISPGDKVQLGEASFIASAAIVKEPDSPQSFFGVAPRIILNIDDIEKTQLIQTGSRINYTWMLAGELKAIDNFKAWLEPNIGEHHRWVSVKEGNRGIEGALQRAEKFLLLAGSLCVVLSGLAIAIAARRYAERQHSRVALLKTFGHTPNAITLLYLAKLILLGFVGVVLGLLGGWLIHLGLLKIVSAFLPTQLAAAGLQAWTVGAVSCFVALAAFAAPPLLNLRQIPPAKVLRKNASGGNLHAALSTAIASIAIATLILWYSKDVFLTAVLCLGGTLCIAGVWLIANSLLTLLRKMTVGLSKNWRLGFANLQRHRKTNSLQITVFSVLLMLLFVMSITRSGLLNEWKKQIPEDAPNHFAFNIFPDEKPALDLSLNKQNIVRQPFYPMVRGRVTHINNETMKERAEKATNRMNYVRELNLTWSHTLGSDNTLLEGTWWNENDNAQLQVSAEQEYANGLGIQIGHELQFSIAGQEVSARVASIRSVKWDSMNPNFFMIFNQPLLDGSTANWLTSFYLPADKKIFLNEITREFPTISIVELDQMLEQVRSIVTQVSLGVEFILVLILTAGIMVLITGIQASLDLRMQESAILRTLGANKKLVTTTLLIEFSSLGFLAGLLASTGAELMLYLLQTRMFDLPWAPHFMLWLCGPPLGAGLIALIGWLSTRKVVLTPPLSVLRSYS